MNSMYKNYKRLSYVFYYLTFIFIISQFSIFSFNNDVYAATVGTPLTISNAVNDQNNPAIASDGTNYLVVYQSGAVGAIDIYGTVLNASGGVVVAPFPITTAAGDQTMPSVAFCNTCTLYKFLVAYQSSSGMNDVYGMYVNYSGSIATVTTVGNAGTGVISAGATRRDEAPSVASDGASRFFVAYVRPNGTVLQIRVASFTGNTANTAAIAYTPSPTTWNVYANLTGCTAPCGRPSISFGPGTTLYYIAYEYSSTTEPNGDIMGGTVSTGGIFTTPINIANTPATLNRYPSVAFSNLAGNLGWLVTWQDARNGVANNDIYGQLITTAGALNGVNFQISGAANDQLSPKVIHDGINFFTTWQDNRIGTGEIYGTGVSSAGAVLSTTGYSIATGVPAKQSPAIGALGSNFLTAWAQGAAGTLDIFGQRANQPGATGLSITTGSVGNAVTLNGNNFGTITDTLNFGGTPATTTTWANTQINFPVPGRIAGNHPVDISVGGWKSNSQTFTVLNSAPTANAGTPQSVNENTLVTLNGSASTDPNGDSISYSWTQIGTPVVTLSSTTAVMPTFTAPSVTTSTILTFQLIVNDGTVNSTASTVTVTVNNVNQPPVLNLIGPKGVNEGSNLNFTINGSDPDGDPVTFSATGLPAGATFNTTTRVFDWTPDYTQAGSYNVTFTVSDGLLIASEVVTITVTNLNRVPVLNFIGAKNVNETANLNFIISGSDPDADPITFSATGLPVGATFNTSTRVFNWTPDYTQAGIYNVTFTVSDGALSANEVVTITVNNVNRAPVLNLIGAKNVNEAANLNFTISGSDPDSDPLTYSSAGLPIGATFNTTTRVFDWTPDYAQAGTYNVTFTVSDGSLSANEVVSITVNNVNRAPVLNTIGAKSINEASNLNFTISGSDPDGDVVTYSATGLPTGATFNTTTRVFDWTPDFTQAGSYNVTFTVSDGSLTASEVVTITVINLNRAPVLNAIGAKNVNEAANLNFIISGSDPDSDPLTYSAAGLPLGATFNTTTRVFDWTPDYTQAGIYNVTFTVSDGSLSANEVVAITVNNVNRAPSLNTIGAKSINEGSNLNFIINGSDPDSDPLTYSAAGLPVGATFNSTTRVFDWTPDYTQTGIYNVTFTVSDGSLSANEVVSITVNNVNRAPVLNAIGAKIVNENVNLNFTVSGSDPDGDTITLSATGMPVGAVFNISTGVFDWTPSYSQSGIYNVTFTISDGLLSTNEVVAITVNNINRSPVLNTIGPKNINENLNLNFTVSGSDLDGDVLTYSATGLPAGAVFNTSTRVFDWTPSYSQSGIYNVTFIVSDGLLTATEVVAITVNNVNQPPVLSTIGSKSVSEGNLLQFTVSASDPDGDTITLSAASVPAWAGFNTTTGLFSGTPGYTDAGIYNVTFTVSDGSLNVNEVVTITVNNVNRSPVLNTIGAKSVNENVNLYFIISGSDPDGDTITYSAAGLPAGATFNSSTRVFDWTPSYSQSGSYNVTFTVSDGSLSTNEVVLITVNNINRSPVLNTIGAKAVNEGSILNFTVSGSDPDSDPLTYSATGLPVGATFNTSTGIFDWTPDYTQTGTYNVTFTVSDGSLSASEVVTISVSNVNRAPVLNAIGAKSVNENVNLNFTVSGSDPDGDAVTLSATGLPVGAAFNTLTGVFDWTPSYSQSGSYNVTFTISDSSLNASEVVTITVSNVNRAPVLNPIGAKSVNENVNINFTISGSDPDGDAVILSATGLPVGAAFNTTTGVFNWTPSYSQSGSYNVTFTISDSSLNASEVVTITVSNVNRTPVLNPIGAKSVNENVNLNFTVIGSDPDGDSIILSAAGLPAGASFNTITGVFDWTPSYSQSGSYNVTFTVSDGSLSASEVVTITVNNINRAPVLNPIGSKSVAEGNLLQFTVSSSDPDGDTVTLSASNVPAWASFNTTTGVFSGTPGIGSSGTYIVTFTSSDGILSTSEIVTITVSNTNLAPVLNPIGAKSVNEAGNLNFTVTASDPNGDPITYSAANLPAGSTFNTTTHVFDWTPSYSQSGSYNVTFTVSDGSLSSSEIVTITVNNVNRAPVLNAIGAKGVNENSNLNFIISGSDPDGDTITYSATGLPTGAAFNTATGVFDWTPAYSQSGSYNVTFTVSDGFLTATEIVTITVNNVNRAPVLNVIGAKGVNENINLNFTISGSDPDGDAVTYAATGLPLGAAFNATTGVFDWTPAYSQSGSYNVTFTVSDGSLSANEAVTITVNNVNRVPVLNVIGAKSVNENSNLNFTVSGSDPDGDAITYSAAGLPVGAAFNTTTGVFNWTPAYSQSGSYNVTFSISDGSLTASEVVTITVNNINQSPILNPIGNKSIAEGNLIQFTVTASDPDGDTLTLNATGIPAWGSFNTTTGLFSGTPGFGSSGSYPVTFTVSDGSLSASEIVTITVSNTNQSPVLNAIGAKSVNENGNLNFTVSGSDPDLDPLNYSATGLPAGAVFNTSTRVFDWTPSYTQSGSYNVTFTVSDGALSASEVVTITVNNINRSPVLNVIGAKSVNENVNLNFTVSGSDPDGDALTLSATGLPIGASFNTTTGVFDWTPSYSQSGLYNVTFMVSDGSLSASEIVTITVSNINRAPVLSAIGAKNVNENINLNFTINGSDLDGDTLSYSATGLPAGATFNTSTRVFDWTPSYSQSGIFTVTFSVSDGSLTASEVVTVTVSNVNRLPVLNAIGAKNVNENSNLNFIVSGSDPDGDALTYSAAGLPVGAAFNTTTRVFDWTPNNAQAGIYNVTFTVSDGSLSASEVVVITVNDMNNAPVLNAIGAKGVNENSNLNFTISGSDPNGDPLTYSAAGLPAGAAFNTSTRVFDWTPSYTQSGSYNVTFTVSDGALSASEVVIITVNNVNRVPVLNAIGAKGVNENSNLNFIVSGSDPDGDTLSYSAVGVPSWAAFNSSTMVFNGTPSCSQAGIYNVTFTVSDGALSASEVVGITVNNVNCSPVLTAVGAKSVNENVNLNFTVSGSDPDGDPLSYSAAGLPAGAVFNTATRVFDWTPSYSQSGIYNMTFTVNDGLLNASEIVAITVNNVNRTPVLNTIGVKSTSENTNLNFTISGSDPDGDTLSYSAAGLPAGAVFNTVTRVFEWTPTYSQAGIYNVTFTVSDGALSASEVVAITVSNVNRGPVLNPIGAKNVDENLNLNFTVSGSDPDGDPLSFSAAGLPAGASFNASTRVFNWTPSYAQAGSYNVNFNVTDGVLNSSEVVTITVNNINQAPSAFAGIDQSVIEGGNVTLQGIGSDADGDPVTFNWVQTGGTPVILNIPNAAASNFTAPLVTLDETLTFQLTVSDGSLFTTDIVNVLVLNTNDADNDGYNNFIDCNDNDPLIHPGALEILDGKDNNCNGTIDEGFDSDGDGFTTFAGDCNNNDATIYPGAPEIVDGKDNNCNSLIDDNTTPGLNVQVSANSSVKVLFSEVITTGTTSVNTGTTGPVVPAGYRLPSTKTYYEIFTTSNFNGSPVNVCITYNELAFTARTISENTIRLFHWNGTQWDDITSAGYPDITANKVCGVTLSFSPFIVAGEASTSAGVYMGADSYNMMAMSMTDSPNQGDDVRQEQINNGNRTQQKEASAGTSSNYKKKNKVSVLGNINVTSNSPSSGPITSIPNRGAGGLRGFSDVQGVAGGVFLDEPSKSGMLTNRDENKLPSHGTSPAMGEGIKFIPSPLTGEGQGGGELRGLSDEPLYQSYSTDSPVNNDMSFTMNDGFGNEFSLRKLQNIQQEVNHSISVSVKDGSALLRWQYSGKAKGFFVQRADSRDKQFIRLQDTRLPVLDSNGVYEYVFNDNNIKENGIYYYRIEIVDQEGHINLTETVSLENMVSSVSILE